MRRPIAVLIDSFLDFVWPPYCLSCELPSSQAPLCTACEDTLVPTHEDCCPHCGIVWLDPPPHGGKHHCGDRLKSPPPWHTARGAFAYGGVLKTLIQRWKNKPDDTLSAYLARLMSAQSIACGWSPSRPDTLVVPIPADRKRLRQRGFHPAGYLARSLAKHIEQPFVPKVLRLIKPLPGTKGLRQDARKSRMHGVFDASSSEIEGRPIFLVDDVMTSGATVKAATQTLLRAGAESVTVAVLARVPFRQSSGGDS